MSTATILPFRKPARTLAERACQLKREAKTAELINEQVTMTWLCYFVAEMSNEDDPVLVFADWGGA